MTKNLLIASLTCTFLITSGCATLDPATRELKPSHTTVGASLGAMSGAFIGALASNSPNGALIGAGIGALAGGAIGNSMDQEEAMLRARLERTGVLVERCGGMIRLIMPCDITFANDSARLLPQFYETLDSVAVVLSRFHGTLIKVAGFTSNTGSVMHNQLLSERRARCVADFLVEAGINPSRLVTIGYGIRHPVASNQTEAGQALNRRVEITIRPLGLVKE